MAEDSNLPPFPCPIPPAWVAELGAPPPKVGAENPLTQEWESPSPRACRSIILPSVLEWAYTPQVEGGRVLRPR